MSGIADVRWAQLKYDQFNALKDKVRKQSSDIKNKYSNMGLGRMFGMAAGTLLGATMGVPLLGIAAMGGLGGRAGAEIGSKMSNVDEVTAGKLFRRQAQEKREEGFEAQSDLNRMANVNIARDAFSIYSLGKYTDMGKDFLTKMKGVGTPTGLPDPTTIAPEAFDYANTGMSQDLAKKSIFNIPKPTEYGSMVDPASGLSSMPTSELVTSQVGHGMGTIATPMQTTARETLRPNVNLLESANITDKVTMPADLLDVDDIFNQRLNQGAQPFQDILNRPLNKGFGFDDTFGRPF